MSMDYREYWDKNISSWGEFYLEISHGDENYEAPNWLQKIYKLTIAKLEKRLMDRRFHLTINFIKLYVKPGSSFLDLGCGTGIFTFQALTLGATVTAVDFSKNALRNSHELCSKHFDEATLKQKLHLKNADVSVASFGTHDTCLVMGVIHYIEDLTNLFELTLQNQKTIMFSYSDKENIFNRIRRIVPILNVRKLQFHSNTYIDKLLTKSNFRTLEKVKLGTGYLVVAQK